jgi:hypothetical protein
MEPLKINPKEGNLAAREELSTHDLNFIAKKMNGWGARPALSQ